MSTRSDIDAEEFAEALLKALRVWSDSPRDKPSRHRLEGAYIAISLMAGIDPDEGHDALLAAGAMGVRSQG